MGPEVSYSWSAPTRVPDPSKPEATKLMTTLPLQLERRVGHRFPFQLPVSLREIANGTEGLGVTQDLSCRGTFFFTDMPLTEGSEIELTLKMPSEITLGESMRVRCRGRILRVTGPVDRTVVGAKAPVQSKSATEIRPGIHSDTKIGVAVCLKGYEYLPEVAEGSTSFDRISALHSHHEEDLPAQERAQLLARS